MPANGSITHTESPWVAEPPRHVLEERAQTGDVGCNTTPARGIPSGRAVHGRHVDGVEGQYQRLNRDVELTSFAQMTHGSGNLAVGPGDHVHE